MMETDSGKINNLFWTIIFIVIFLIIVVPAIIISDSSYQKNVKNEAIIAQNLEITARKISQFPVMQWPDLLKGQDVGVLNKMGMTLIKQEDWHRLFTELIYQKDRNFLYVKTIYPAKGNSLIIIEAKWLDFTPKI